VSRLLEHFKIPACIVRLEMKALLAAFLIFALLPALAVLDIAALLAGPPPIRIVLTDKSRIPSAEIVTGLSKQCPNVTLTTDVSSADYSVEAKRDFSYFTMALFNRSGDAIYSTKTVHLGNAIKDLCRAINAQKNGGAR
jgi:hypothetical protein